MAKPTKRKMTKAGRLLQIAYATYKRGEAELAKDIFVLAVNEEDAKDAMSDMAAPELVQSEDDVKKELMSAMEDGDMAKAEECLDKLKAMKANGGGTEHGTDEPAAAAADDDEDDAAASEEEDEEPAAGGASDESEMPQAQVATLVALAQKIKKAGHADLARKISAALGM